ncbi:MAG TPA: DUF4251 domain-containing protein [Draconibacterium sp.]|nr:DUF4251 domain-containing protein [Draconibacterium sp.]
MKNLLIVVLIVVSANIGFAQETMTRKEKREAQKAEQIKKTKLLVESNAWQFDAEQMLPTSGKSKTLTTPYNIVVKDGELNSYLPYFGRAYRADYGSTESPLIFESEIRDYKVEPGKKNDWNITFETKNKNDVLNYNLYISESGSSSLRINSTDRQSISFHGNLVEIEEKK